MAWILHATASITVAMQPVTAINSRRPQNARSLWFTLQQTFSAWNDHEASRLGAALAFYTILSLAPLVTLVIALVALALGHSTAQDQIIAQFQGMIGQDGASAVRTMIENAQKPASGIFAS